MTVVDLKSVPMVSMGQVKYGIAARVRAFTALGFPQIPKLLRTKPMNTGASIKGQLRAISLTPRLLPHLGIASEAETLGVMLSARMSAGGYSLIGGTGTFAAHVLLVVITLRMPACRNTTMAHFSIVAYISSV